MPTCVPASIMAPEQRPGGLSHHRAHPWVQPTPRAAPMKRRSQTNPIFTSSSQSTLRNHCNNARSHPTVAGESGRQIEQTNPIFTSSSQSTAKYRCCNAWWQFRLARQRSRGQIEQTNPIFTSSSQFMVRFRRRDHGRDVAKASERTHRELGSVLRIGQDLGILGIARSRPPRNGSACAPDLSRRCASPGGRKWGRHRPPSGRAVDRIKSNGALSGRAEHRETNGRWDHPARPPAPRPDQPGRLSQRSVIPARRVNS
jgi:hypothetical protein